MQTRRLNPGLRGKRALAMLAVAASLAALAGCAKPAAPPPPPPEVGVIKLRAVPADVTVEYVAQTEAYNATEIRPRVGGLLEKQVAVEGSTVKKGQVLFVIDQQPYIVAIAQAKAAQAQAEAALEQSKRDLARVQPLSEVDAVSQQERDAVVARNEASRAVVEAAAATMKTAELNLGYTTVTSPIDGIVGRTQMRVGGVVTAYTTLLTTVYASDPMYVNFNVSERRMLELQHRFGTDVNGHYTGPDTFKILLADDSAYPLPAKLNFVDATVDQTTGTVRVRLSVPNPQHLLRNGQFARVVVTVDRLPQAILIPQRAVQELQGKTSVWIVDAEGKAQTRDLRMGARIAADWVAEEGLKEGETVVVDGVQKLKPGMTVNAQPIAAQPAAAKAPAEAGAKP